MVTGTQAPKAHLNTIHVLHLSRMTKFKQKNNDEESDEESESSDEEDDGSPDSQPLLRSAEIPHPWGAINRIRFAEVGSSMLAASWCDSGAVRIWNLNKQLQELKNSFFNKSEAGPPLFTFSGHQVEGFSIAWSDVAKGYLATGDCAKNIHIWVPNEAGTWHVDQTPLIGHTKSVEDIQWSPTEPNVIASCSVDKSIRIWDTRARNLSSCMIAIEDAHESDVNVISWNKLDTFFLLSGGDDGAIKVWDFRKFANSVKTNKPVAVFKYHLEPITSVEWHPSDNTVFAASGEDHQITLWDLAVEKDDEEIESEDQELKEEGADEDEENEELKAEKNAPPQLLFVHRGQRDIKELHFHPQIPGLVISTAANSFDIFKTISV
uniref:Glutamate-rich WD repeat-containing protein 1 n=2 Tax=Tetranychus urticae TaxID=32264 RepID=T1KJ81_TETUR